MESDRGKQAERNRLSVRVSVLPHIPDWDCPLFMLARTRDKLCMGNIYKSVYGRRWESIAKMKVGIILPSEAFTASGFKVCENNMPHP